MNLYSEITENGYYIKDRDSSLVIHQYEPFIPYRGESYEESAQNHIEAINNSYSLGYDVPDSVVSGIESSLISTIKSEVIKNV